MLSKRNLIKKGQVVKIEEKKKLLELRAKMRDLVQKSEDDLTSEDHAFMAEYSWLHKTVCHSLRAKTLRKDRKKEMSEPESLLSSKLDQLAALLRQHRGHTLVYTGAGISTAASIPDYRGPQGKWTLGERQFSLPEASHARPTVAHMALVTWMEAGLVAHVVSQNVDCLHLRSGLPRDKISEIHGNLFSELCPTCHHEVFRLFDVSERTAPRRHSTGRRCPSCSSSPASSSSSAATATLVDTVVHFGERSRELGEGCVYRWRRVEQLLAARCPSPSTSPPSPSPSTSSSSDDDSISLILCLGSSLQVLRHYSILWPPSSTKLVIVNLQWTPKDRHSTLKIHAPCDQVMQEVSQRLNLSVKEYDPVGDPLRRWAVPLSKDEEDTRTRPDLVFD